VKKDALFVFAFCIFNFSFHSMKILHISSARTLGGGERHLADLLNALALRGHEVYAAVPANSPLREELHALPSESIFTLRLRNALDVGSARGLSRLIRQYQIEILHAHVARDYPLAALALRSNRRTKLVITRHVLFPLSRIHKLTFARVSRLMAVSGAVARAVQAQGICPANKIVTVPNGIDLNRFNVTETALARDEFRRKLGIRQSKRLVGTVGEIRPLKGLEDFIRAAAFVAQEMDDVDFVIAGQDASPTGEHRARLELLIEKLDLSERVHFTGWLTDVAPLLHTLDLFISPSHSEAFGLSIVEAMACGLGVIATCTEGAREIIEDGTDGLLVPVGDIERLAAATLALLKDERHRQEFGERAREKAQSRFSLERMVSAVEEIYSQALSDDLKSR
jgi:glycosyltransferase involved in cell wall biosynthesis